MTTCIGCGRETLKVAPSGLCQWPSITEPNCSLRFWRYLQGHSEYRSEPLALDAIRVLRDQWLEAGAP